MCESSAATQSTGAAIACQTAYMSAIRYVVGNGSLCFGSARSRAVPSGCASAQCCARNSARSRAPGGGCSSAGGRRRPPGRGRSRSRRVPQARRATCASFFGACSGASLGNAEAVQRDHVRDARRARAGVAQRDVGAEAVTGDVDRLAGRQRARQRVEVRDVVQEPVAVLRRFRQPEAAPVGREHVPVVRERIDQELERRRHVHPAVQQEQFRARRDRPTCARDTTTRESGRSATGTPSCAGRRSCRRRRCAGPDRGRARGARARRRAALSLLAALRQSVLPADAVVAVVGEAHRILLLGAASRSRSRRRSPADTTAEIPAGSRAAVAARRTARAFAGAAGAAAPARAAAPAARRRAPGDDGEQHAMHTVRSECIGNCTSDGMARP